MQDFEKLLAEQEPPRSTPLVKHAKFADFLEEHGLLIGGAAVGLIAIVLSLPSLLANQATTDRLAAEMSPLIAENQRQSALSAIASARNEIAETRYGDANCVRVKAVISGEPAIGLDGNVVSANSTVCGENGLTAKIVAHPTGRQDPVTGFQMMRPIADDVIGSNGPNYKTFMEKKNGTQNSGSLKLKFRRLLHH